MSTNLTTKQKMDRSARRWAWIVLIAGVLVSTVANALSARFEPISIGVAVTPPLALFGVSMLLERIPRVTSVVRALLTLSAITAGTFSWVHIAHVAILSGQPVWISWALPAIVDIPMLLAGITLIQVKTPAKRTQATKVTAVTTPAKKTSPVKRTSQANRTNGVKVPQLQTV